MKTVSVKAGERQCVIHRFSNSLQETYHFNAAPINPTDKLNGVVEVCGSNWLFPKPSTQQNLAAENSVSKGMWDVFYSVYVTPDIDVKLTISNTQRPNLKILLVIAGIVSIVALAFVTLTL